jgi:hypothetical protein
MVSRHTNRRMQILRSLAALPFPAARQALVRLQQRETDPNLRLRLAQYLHAAAGGTDSGGTVSGDDDGRDPAAGGRDG